MTTPQPTPIPTYTAAPTVCLPPAITEAVVELVDTALVVVVASIVIVVGALE